MVSEAYTKPLQRRKPNLEAVIKYGGPWYWKMPARDENASNEEDQDGDIEGQHGDNMALLAPFGQDSAFTHRGPTEQVEPLCDKLAPYETDGATCPTDKEGQTVEGQSAIEAHLSAYEQTPVFQGFSPKGTNSQHCGPLGEKATAFGPPVPPPDRPYYVTTRRDRVVEMKPGAPLPEDATSWTVEGASQWWPVQRVAH